MQEKVRRWISNLLEVMRFVCFLICYVCGFVLLVAVVNQETELMQIFSPFVGEKVAGFFVWFGLFAVIFVFYLVITMGWKGIRKFYDLPEPTYQAPCWIVFALLTVAFVVFGIWLSYRQQVDGVLPRPPEQISMFMAYFMRWCCGVIIWILLIFGIFFGAGYVKFDIDKLIAEAGCLPDDEEIDDQN